MHSIYMYIRTGCKLSSNVIDMHIYMYVAIHALASMPSAPRLSEADSKTSTYIYYIYTIYTISLLVCVNWTVLLKAYRYVLILAHQLQGAAA
jgi:hypothetical protein